MNSLPKWLIELLLVITAVLFIRATLVQAFNIPSASMQPTLLVGDFILVNKLVYRLSKPQRGDIVVFKYPANPSIDYIKRVIGEPGDTVEFEEFYDNEAKIKVYKVKVNGEELNLRFVGLREFQGRFYYEFEEGFYRVWFSPSPIKTAGLVSYAAHTCMKWKGNLCVKFIVPEDHYFVMGDNRDNSEDSRFWGFVPKKNITGKAFVIYFSGKVPSLTPEDVSLFTGIKQLLIALMHPRPERIGTHFIRKGL